MPLDAATWPLVLDCLKKSHNTLYGIARMSRPVFLDDSLELYFRFPFHQRRVSEAKNRDVILGAIRQQTGRTVAIRCLVEERGDGQGNRTDAPPRAETFTAAAEPAAPPQPRPVTDPGILAAVNDIFGI